MPASLAWMMAWARSVTWSLARMLDTWLRTVLGLSDSRVAIAVLARPWASRSRTWGSRLVSWGRGGGGAGGAVKQASIRAAGWAAKMMPPLAAAWMAQRICSRLAPLSRYPRAPARSADRTEPSSSNMVSTSTATWG